LGNLGTPLFGVSVRSQELGVPGEACIVGAVGTGRTNGHFHRNHLTGKRLVDFAGARLYRTDGRANRYVRPAINRTSGVRLSLRTVFDAPTIQQLTPRGDDPFGPAVLESMSDEEADRPRGATSADSAL
jgi:hypothetical protein